MGNREKCIMGKFDITICLARGAAIRDEIEYLSRGATWIADAQQMGRGRCDPPKHHG